MWSAWLSLKTYQSKPSNELEVTDTIAAYCVDKAVMWFGITVENLLSERVEVGSGKEKHSEAKYELDDLLDADFRVPRELPKPKKMRQREANTPSPAMQAMLNTAVKRWRPISPA